MTINRNNYEAYFIDYLDGQMTEEVRSEMLLFLELNPDIRKEFDMFSKTSVCPDKNCVYKGKEWLKKYEDDISGSIPSPDDQLAIAALEGDLSESDKIAFKLRLSSDADFAALYLLYSKLHAVPEQISASGFKDHLKRKAITVHKEFNLHSYDELFASYFEGDMEEECAHELSVFLTLNPALKDEFTMMGKLRYEADLSKVYPDKNRLKKQTIIRQLVSRPWISTAAAASIALLLTFNIFFSPEKSDLRQLSSRRTTHGKQVYAHTNPIVITPSKLQETKSTNPKAVFIQRTDELLPMQASGLSALEVALHHSGPSEENRNYYTSLYYDLQIANDLLQKETSFTAAAGNPLLSLADYGRSRVRSFFNPAAEPEPLAMPSISLWDFADAGIAQINRLTSSDIKLERGGDGKDVKNFAISGGLFEISRNQSRP
jgi:hypothetical protein